MSSRPALEFREEDGCRRGQTPADATRPPRHIWGMDAWCSMSVAFAAR
ncbi:hypothetical protein WDH52_21910 [Streptomyces sp. TRM70308]